MTTEPPPPSGPRFIPNASHGTPPPSQPPSGGGGTPPSGGAPPPPGWSTPPSGGTPPPPKKRHRARNVLAIIGSLVLLLIIVAVATGGHSNTNTSSSANASSSGSGGSPAPASQAAAAPTPSPTPTLQPPTQVEFIVSGYAPGDGYGSGPTVDYGSDSDTHEAQPASIDGTLTYSVPYDPSAQYYSVNAQLTGSGNLSCKIVVTGPYPDKPLTVSSGSASGGYSICSAQAAPTDPSGLTWNNEE